MGEVFLFGPLILTNNWGFRTNTRYISLDKNFPYIHDIVMGIHSVSPSTLKIRVYLSEYPLQQPSLHLTSFLAHLVYQPESYTIMLCPSSLALSSALVSSSSVHTPPPLPQG